jgi:hypothetical protein
VSFPCLLGALVFVCMCVHLWQLHVFGRVQQRLHWSGLRAFVSTHKGLDKGLQPVLQHLGCLQYLNLSAAEWALTVALPRGQDSKRENVRLGERVLHQSMCVPCAPVCMHVRFGCCWVLQSGTCIRLCTQSAACTALGAGLCARACLL